MFKVAVNPTYRSPVTVPILTDDNQVIERTFTAIFKRLDQDQIDDLYGRIARGELTDRKLIDEVMVGWGTDVCDEDGTALEFNQRNLNALLAIHPTREYLARKFYDTVQSATLKNLLTLQRGGQAAAGEANEPTSATK